MNHFNIRQSYLYALVGLVAVILVSIVYVGLKENRKGVSVELQTSKAGSCYGYGYGYPCPEPGPYAALSYRIFDYNYSRKVWNAEIQYQVINVSAGSLVEGKKVLVNNISQNGVYKTTLKPDSVHKYSFYSQPRGKGTVLANLEVRAPFAPTPYGYGY